MPRKSGAEEWVTEDNLLRLEGWARDGLTDKQIAETKVGINESTFCAWKNKYPEIKQALKKGKEPVDMMVENALLKRALGYEYEEVTVELYEENGEQKKKIKKTKRQVVPDTTAQIFWLKNRRSDKWRDKQEIQDTAALDKLDAILDGMEKKAYAETK